MNCNNASYIYRTLSTQIITGALTHQLPSERKLSEQFQTTRITLREALTQLEHQGLIYRENRRGWFVSPPRIQYNPLLNFNFNRMVSSQGKIPSTQVLSSEILPADDWISSHLHISVGQPIIQIRRARRIDNRLVLYAEHYLKPEIFPNILQFDFSQSLSEIYQSHYQIDYGKVRFEMQSSALDKQAASVLKMSEGSPALQIVRVNQDQHGRFIDCDVELWRHDALTVCVEI